MSTAIPAARDLAPENVILGLLNQQPAHGYELHRRLTDELGQVWHLPLNQVYNILNRLEERGLVSGAAEPGLGGPERRRFKLTEAGRTRFRIWLYSLTPCNIRAIRVELTTRLYFARDVSPDLAQRLLSEQTALVQEFQAQLCARLEALPPAATPGRMALALRVRTLAVIVEWLGEYRALVLPPF